MTPVIKNMTSGSKGAEPMPEPTVAAGFARALLDLAVSKGASRKALIERSQIDPEELQDQDNRIPLAKYAALMSAGKELCHDPALALHFGEAIDASEISIATLVGATSKNWADAFTQMNRYAQLDVELDSISAHDRFVLTRRRGQLWIIDTRTNANDFPELTESTFARMVCTSRRALGEKQFVKGVHVTHAEPEYRAEYDRIFRVPVVFESDENALVTDDSWLTRRTPRSSQYVAGMLSTHAHVLLKRLESSKSTRGRVERVLIPVLHAGDVSMQSVATKLRLSRQTLFRRLKAEGVTFEKVLDQLRHKLALRYLRERKFSVKETAYLVGFSEPAAFSRAFKRWTGTSPRMARLKP